MSGLPYLRRCPLEFYDMYLILKGFEWLLTCNMNFGWKQIFTSRSTVYPVFEADAGAKSQNASLHPGPDRYWWKIMYWILASRRCMHANLMAACCSQAKARLTAHVMRGRFPFHIHLLSSFTILQSAEGHSLVTKTSGLLIIKPLWANIMKRFPGFSQIPGMQCHALGVSNSLSNWLGWN